MTGTSLIWSALGWGMAALAVALLLLALFGDAVRRRFRKVRRCPKCWYDLSHTPGMTCSECGYTARRERQLFRTRRRKRWVLAALLMWIGSSFAFRVPAMQQRGWVAAVPTTALVFLWPRERVRDRYVYLLSHPQFVPRLHPALREAPFTQEMLQRIDDRELNRVHWRLLIEMAIRTANHPAPLRVDEDERRPLCIGMLTLAEQAGRLNNPALLRKALTAGALRMTTRTRWPVGETMYAAVWEGTFAGQFSPEHIRAAALLSAEPSTPGLRSLTVDEINASRRTVPDGPRAGRHPYPTVWRYCERWDDALTAIGPPTTRSAAIRYVVSVERRLTESQAQILGTEVLRTDVAMTFDCRIEGTIDDILTPVESPEFDAAVNEGLRPVLDYNHVDLNINYLEHAFEHLGGATFAATLELLLDDEVVARGEAWWRAGRGPIAANGRPAPLVVPHCDYVPIDPITPRRIDPSETRYRLRLTPNPRMALRRFESDTYWSGVIEVPVRPLPEGLWP